MAPPLSPLSPIRNATKGGIYRVKSNLPKIKIKKIFEKNLMRQKPNHTQKQPPNSSALTLFCPGEIMRLVHPPPCLYMLSRAFHINNARGQSQRGLTEKKKETPISKNKHTRRTFKNPAHCHHHLTHDHNHVSLFHSLEITSRSIPLS